MTSESYPPPRHRLAAIVESLLFVADEPVAIGHLAQVLEVEPELVAEALASLALRYRERGLRLQETADTVQMVTAPETAPYVERFLGVDPDRRLSHAALETLAIIAYRQPMARADIEAIRGVNCDRAIAALKSRGLIAEVGRAQGSGRPFLYGTTFRFLEYFGLERPEDLPPLPDLQERA